MKINPDSVADIQQEFGLDIDSENDLTFLPSTSRILSFTLMSYLAS